VEILAKTRGTDPVRFDRVVLTTNAHPASFERHIDAIDKVITHLNISRHAVDERDNRRVFRQPPGEDGNNRIPTLDQLRGFVSTLTSRGKPVNFNCVYSESHFLGRQTTGVATDDLRGRALSYIAMARELGATSVVFRHDHRDPHLDDSTWLERCFRDYQDVHEASCESCHVVTKLIDGLPVNFKRSGYEPIDLHPEDELYELIFHSDGTLARDWSRKKPLSLSIPTLHMSNCLDAMAGTKHPLVLLDEECRSLGGRCRPVSAVSQETLLRCGREV
jgi:hypothetical protein